MERISSFKSYPVPAMKASFYTDAQVNSNVKPIISKIKGSNYISTLRRYARKMSIPENVLIAFYAVESSGNDRVGMNSAGAIGLGQVTRPAAYDAIKREIQDGYLTDEEKAYIKRKVPALGKNDFRIKFGDFEGVTYAGSKDVQAQLLTALRDDTEFNIFISSMIVAQLAERYRAMEYPNYIRLLPTTTEVKNMARFLESIQTLGMQQKHRTYPRRQRITSKS